MFTTQHTQAGAASTRLRFLRAIASLSLAGGLCTAAQAAGSQPEALRAGMDPAVQPGGLHEHEHKAALPRCDEVALRCASEATPFIDAKGTLWLAWSASGAVSVASSSDGGRSFGTPVVIGQHGDRLDVGADARPQVLADAKGRLVVAYGVFKDKNWNAQVMVATSGDGGKTFSAPRSLSQDGASQRFPALAADADGRLVAAWLDKRGVALAKKNGRTQNGAAVAYATSTDGGVSFGPETIAQDHTCECCHIGLAFDASHRPVLLFRNIFGERERDHAVLTLTAQGTPGPLHRVAVDRWEIDGCPHQGPSLAVSADGSYQAAWFTQGELRQGLFVARSTDAGKTFSAPQAVGNPDQQAARPALLAHGDAVWLAWKEFDGKRIFIKERHSTDAGLTWSADRVVATTGGYGDHPVLVADARHVFLSWMTRDQGYRLIPLEAS